MHGRLGLDIDVYRQPSDRKIYGAEYRRRPNRVIRKPGNQGQQQHQRTQSAGFGIRVLELCSAGTLCPCQRAQHGTHRRTAGNQSVTAGGNPQRHSDDQRKSDVEACAETKIPQTVANHKGAQLFIPEDIGQDRAGIRPLRRLFLYRAGSVAQKHLPKGGQQKGDNIDDRKHLNGERFDQEPAEGGRGDIDAGCDKLRH